ncbi:MAG: tRNA (adenosine(37)-N6)-threonylcarbamoyltransferase complex transferase subunit TsaD, partial [Patescibacteria group bacterium]
MRVLGIETSCDDTAIGIVTYRHGRFTIEAQVTASQALMHRRYGGVVPEVAAREHALTILPTLKAAMKSARVGWNNIDTLAVTGGPGLNTALVVGVETARALSYVLKKPAVRVNHIEGHVVSAWASPSAASIKFPAVALIVSGGHTELILVKRLGQYKLLGRTLDDAVGEAFDKVAKILGLPYPGGPEIATRAARGDASVFTFPRALMRPGNLDFSYSGLKTSVLYELQKHRHRTASLVNDLAAGFQVAAVEPLVTKTRWAVEKVGAKTVLLGGGVAANMMLREKLLRAVTDGLYHVRFVPPSLSLCMDNGVMIAMA